MKGGEDERFDLNKILIINPTHIERDK